MGIGVLWSCEITVGIRDSQNYFKLKVEYMVGLGPLEKIEPFEILTSIYTIRLNREYNPENVFKGI